jgi:hypothetical protein
MDPVLPRGDETGNIIAGVRGWRRLSIIIDRFFFIVIPAKAGIQVMNSASAED